MFDTIKIIHIIVVIIFLLIYFVKTILLISNKEDALTKFTKMLRIPEMIVSFLFLATGIYLLTQVAEIKPLLIVKIGLVFLSIPIAVIGFKKRNKILGALAFFMLVASYGLAEIAAKPSKAKIDANAVETDGKINGNVIYSANCATCHGVDGKKGMSGAADISQTQLSADSIKQVILHGKGMMQPIPGLTNEQAAAIAEYVSTSIKGK
jgi:mono/diheme cytochrome c family protein